MVFKLTEIESFRDIEVFSLPEGTEHLFVFIWTQNEAVKQLK